MFPAGILPPQTVFAIATDGSRFYTVETILDQAVYTLLGVKPGNYFVLSTGRTAPFARAASSGSGSAAVYRFGAGYTRSVPCGLTYSCKDHTLISIHVTAGASTGGIDPTDWYVDPGFYPTIPGGWSPVPAPHDPPPAFQDPAAAASYFAAADINGRYVGSQADCPINVACVWITGHRDGQAAAYFTAQAGSNGHLQNCVYYLISTASGWEALGGYQSQVCAGSGGTPFPTVGASGQVQVGLGDTGCVHVHSAPGLSAKVVGCLAPGTAIRIDDGPAYVAAVKPLPQIDLQSWTLDYWWHIAGRGWIVQTYVVTRHYG
jgi:hypothetical protein